MPVTDLASLASEVGLPAEELARECDPDGQELSELFTAFGVQAMAVKMVVKAQLRTCRAQMSGGGGGGGGGDPGNGGYYCDPGKTEPVLKKNRSRFG